MRTVTGFFFRLTLTLLVIGGGIYAAEIAAGASPETVMGTLVVFGALSGLAGLISLVCLIWEAE